MRLHYAALTSRSRSSTGEDFRVIPDSRYDRRASVNNLWKETMSRSELAHLRIDDSVADAGIRSAVIEIPGCPHKSLRYESYDGPLSPAAGADPFLLGSLLLFMMHGADVHVHGSVTGRLIRHLDELQNIWCRWKPETYSKIQITCDEVSGGFPEDGPAISAFSGGVDATYTVQQHRIMAPHACDLRAVVFIHGFDIPEIETEMFNRARSRGELMLKGLELRTLGLRSNIRSLEQPWEDVFGLAVASCLSLFQPEYRVGLIGSSEPYDELVLPWGSSPVTDHLYSTGLMDIRHDGAGSSRTDKLARLAEWPEAIRYLRVCWQGQQLDRNCGGCEKCIRTYLNFKAAGIASPDCFENLPDRAAVRRLIVRSRAQLNELESIYDYARRANRRGMWLTDLRYVVKKNRLVVRIIEVPWFQSIIRKLKAKYARLMPA